MSIRFRRSVKIARGVRLSASKTGFGVSAGIPGARYSVHASGRRTTTVGIPGSGVSSVSTSGGVGGGTRASTRSRQGVPAPAAAIVSGADVARYLPKAGLFAGTGEKRYRDGLVAYLSGDKASALSAFEAALGAEPKAVSAHLLAALSMAGEAETARAIAHLEALVTTNEAFPTSSCRSFCRPGERASASA
jgi:hypothetical protein